MPGWEVRSFRRAAIVYRGDRYFVAAKERDRRRFRYTLERWDDERGDIDGGSSRSSTTRTTSRRATTRLERARRRAASARCCCRSIR